MQTISTLYNPSTFGSFSSIPKGRSALLMNYLRSMDTTELKQLASDYEKKVASDPTRFDYIEILSYISTIKRERS